ncbi:MAG: hypothetical protein ACRDNG_10310 [Gaiellaceae bacterium]
MLMGARLLVAAVAFTLVGCGALLSGRGDAPPDARTLHIVIHNSTQRELVLSFEGTGSAGFSQVGESLVATCAVSTFAFALPNEWQLRIDDALALASDEQAEVYLQPQAHRDVTLVTRADQGGLHFDRLRAGTPTESETAGPIAGCP